MIEVTIIGLGLMGSALARAAQAGGHSLTVWNRSPVKMEPFIRTGARGAPHIAAAVQASRTILVCIDSYAATLQLMTEEVTRALPGRTVVQLSTGTPKEARDSEERFLQWGADYLDGAILCGPDAIGTPRAAILVAGKEAAFRGAEPILKCLAGDLRHVGANIGAASALDLAWLSEIFGGIVGVCHGARVCEAEGVGLDVYASIFDEKDIARLWAGVIHQQQFAKPSATLRVWYGALERIRSQAADAGITQEFPQFVGSLLKRAIAVGFGEEHVTAIVKTLVPEERGTTDTADDEV